MLIRPTTEADLDRILAWPVTGPAGVIPAGRYRDELARHEYRPEWTWIAEDERRILARAIWWGFGGATYPLVLEGYIGDLVAETTRFHAARGEPRISATTDTTNLPMAAAFERAGYRAWGIRYVLSEPAG